VDTDVLSTEARSNLGIEARIFSESSVSLVPATHKLRSVGCPWSDFKPSSVMLQFVKSNSLKDFIAAI
jgi:hypothetical protein